MNWVVGIIGLAIFIALCIAISSMWDAGWRALNRKVLFRAKYSRAMTEIHDLTAFVTELSPQKAVRAVRDDLKARPSEGLLRVGVSAEEVGASTANDYSSDEETSQAGLVITIGSLISSAYVCVLSAWHQSGSTYVHLKVLKWQEMDGLPTHTKHFYELKEDVAAALRRRDPGVRRAGSGNASIGHAVPGTGGPPLGTLRVCVEQSCDLRDQPTRSLRCPHCDRFTQLNGRDLPAQSGPLVSGRAEPAVMSHRVGSTPLGSPRVCVQLSCDLKDQPTHKLRCAHCDEFTQLR